MTRRVGDVVAVLVAFLVAAAIAGALWPQVVDPVVVERSDMGLLTGEVELADRFDSVGWYSLLGGGLGLLLGAVLMARRQGDELVTLLSVLVGSCLAAWLSARLGTWWGPGDPNEVLADAAVGATAEAQVVLGADVAYLTWPISALVGCLLVLFGRPDQAVARDAWVDQNRT